MKDLINKYPDRFRSCQKGSKAIFNHLIGPIIGPGDLIQRTSMIPDTVRRKVLINHLCNYNHNYIEILLELRFLIYLHLDKSFCHVAVNCDYGSESLS